MGQDHNPNNHHRHGSNRPDHKWQDHPLFRFGLGFWLGFWFRFGLGFWLGFWHYKLWSWTELSPATNADSPSKRIAFVTLWAADGSDRFASSSTRQPAQTKGLPKIFAACRTRGLCPKQRIVAVATKGLRISAQVIKVTFSSAVWTGHINTHAAPPHPDE
jgi:hypothetical protein